VGMQLSSSPQALTFLQDYLQPKTLLLILDNCEHLLEACSHLADALLHACPNLHMLASSREALGIEGEISFRIPPLAFPKADESLEKSLENLAHYEAIRLFVERARAVLPDYQITAENSPAIAQVCQRLDGIPLAIELATARLKLLSAEEIARRLDDRFRLLTGGSRAALPRYQTLRASMDWSYELLSPAERALLQRLSVFAGSWTLEAAEVVGC
jgi:predicted ATPase